MSAKSKATESSDGSTALTLTDDQRRDLTDSRSDFSAEDRVVIATAYILSRENSALAADRATKTLGREVLAGTIRQWKRRAWWPKAEEVGRLVLRSDLENKYVALLAETEEGMADRIADGDVRIFMCRDSDGASTPMERRVPVTLRDLVGAHAIVSDKLAMMRGEPTGRKEDTGVALAMKLADLLQQRGEKKIAAAIDGEFEEVK